MIIEAQDTYTMYMDLIHPTLFALMARNYENKQGRECI